VGHDSLGAVTQRSCRTSKSTPAAGKRRLNVGHAHEPAEVLLVRALIHPRVNMHCTACLIGEHMRYMLAPPAINNRHPIEDQDAILPIHHALGLSMSSTAKFSPRSASARSLTYPITTFAIGEGTTAAATINRGQIDRTVSSNCARRLRSHSWPATALPLRPSW
jgi:hypothetical protein